MTIEVLYSKIHRLRVTGAHLHYIGSITLDSDLIDAAKLIVGQKVSVVNVDNGARFDTYIIRGSRGSGEVTLNGPAARRVQQGDIIIVMAFAAMTVEEARGFQPTLLFPEEPTNRLRA